MQNNRFKREKSALVICKILTTVTSEPNNQEIDQMRRDFLIIEKEVHAHTYMLSVSLFHSVQLDITNDHMIDIAQCSENR